MKKIIVNQSHLQGQISLPPSKSHTLRALIFGMMGNGLSIVHNYLRSPDTDALLKIMSDFGVKTEVKNSSLYIHGIGQKKFPGGFTINCNNSGILLRFFTALSALSMKKNTITGDLSIQTNRDMSPLIFALNKLGAFAKSEKGNNLAPIEVYGPVTQNEATVQGADSQFVSALLILGAFAPFPLNITVENPGEKPWINLTLNWFDRLSIPYEKNPSYTSYKTFGKTSYEGFEYTVPADLSSAAFPVAAALITQSELTINDIDLNDVQGDKKILSILESMGAQFIPKEKEKKLHILKSSKLQGKAIDMNDCIDAISVMAVIACYANGTTTLYNASIAKTKECNRLEAIFSELKKLGANIKLIEDGLVIEPSKLKPAVVSSFDDHRIIMSLAVAGFGIPGQTTIENTGAISKTYQSFVRDLASVNANIEEVV